MRTLQELSDQQLDGALASDGLCLQVGPYIYRLKSNVAVIYEGLRTLYADFPIAHSDSFVDFDIAVAAQGLKNRLKHQAEFLFDGQSPFDPMSAAQSYAFLEWGMNWCISINMNEYLKLHAAVVSKNGIGVVMPGVPGAGKSTLCAALALSGWRVLSDEHALIPPMTTSLVPLYRPVSLKNESIDVIRAFDASAVLGPISRNTHKGEVAHLKADLAADTHHTDAINAHMMIFPRYSKEEPEGLYTRQRSTSFVLAAYHSFNYSLMGKAGFDAMQHLIHNVECYDLVYHDMDWAIAAVETLL